MNIKALDVLREHFSTYGTDTSHDLVHELCDRIEREVTRFIELPVDENGEVIHIGDEMEGFDKYDPLVRVKGKVVNISFDASTEDNPPLASVSVRVWDEEGKSHHYSYLDPNASVFRHYHEPTVEDLLRDMHGKLYEAVRVRWASECTIGEYHEKVEEILAEYAAKLRLAGDDE